MDPIISFTVELCARATHSTIMIHKSQLGYHHKCNLLIQLNSIYFTVVTKHLKMKCVTYLTNVKL
jgi:hypothetical protein